MAHHFGSFKEYVPKPIPESLPYSEFDILQAWTRVKRLCGIHDFVPPLITHDAEFPLLFDICTETWTIVLNTYHIPQKVPPSQHIWWLEHGPLLHEFGHYHIAPYDANTIIRYMLLIHELWPNVDAKRTFYLINFFTDLVVNFYLTDMHPQYRNAMLYWFKMSNYHTKRNKMTHSDTWHIFVRIHEFKWREKIIAQTMSQKKEAFAYQVYLKLTSGHQRADILRYLIEEGRQYFEADLRQKSTPLEQLYQKNTTKQASSARNASKRRGKKRSHSNTKSQQTNSNTSHAKNKGQQGNTGTQNANSGGQQSNSGGQQSNSGGQQSNSGGQQSNSGSQQGNTGTQNANSGSQQSNSGGQQSNSGSQQGNTETQNANSGSQQSNSGGQQSNIGGQQGNTETQNVRSGGQQSSIGGQNVSSGGQFSNNRRRTRTTSSFSSSVDEHFKSAAEIVRQMRQQQSAKGNAEEQRTASPITKTHAEKKRSQPSKRNHSKRTKKRPARQNVWYKAENMPYDMMQIMGNPYDEKFPSKYTKKSQKYDMEQILETLMTNSNRSLKQCVDVIQLSQYTQQHLSIEMVELRRMYIDLISKKMLNYESQREVTYQTDIDGYEPWRWHHQTQELNFEASIAANPLYFFPPFAKKRQYLHGTHGERDRMYRDILFVVDSSSSMGGVTYRRTGFYSKYDYTLLSLFSVLNACTDKQNDVAIINFSTYAEIHPWVKVTPQNKRNLQTFLMHPISATTTFPIMEIQEMVAKRREVLLFILTDGLISNLHETIEYFESLRGKTPIVLVFLDDMKQYPREMLHDYQRIGVKPFLVTEINDLWHLTINNVFEYW